MVMESISLKVVIFIKEILKTEISMVKESTNITIMKDQTIIQVNGFMVKKQIMEAQLLMIISTKEIGQII